jgi:hypothetical protein
LEKLLNQYNLSESELKTILKSSRTDTSDNTKKIDIGSNKFYYAYFSDPHIGHKEFQPQIYESMLKLMRKYKPDFVLNAGDTLEGMSNRPGHVYELTHIGFNAQFNYAKDLLSQIEIPIYGIDGNHDGWYFNKSDLGVIVGTNWIKTLLIIIILDKWKVI